MAYPVAMILACLTFFLAPIVSAHSWIDYIVDDNNPNNVGYPRGYAGHDADLSITQYKVLSRDPTLPVCGPSQRSATAYTAQYPMLTVAAGSPLSAIYLENGHVTKDRLPPDNSPHPGNYSWYLSPVSGSLVTFGDLTQATKLSGPSPFDDGKCAVDASGIQGRPGPINCVSHLTLPATLAAGRYQLVWWWDFTKLTLQDPSYTEYYTTCLDVEVTAGLNSSASSANSASIAANAFAQVAMPSMSALYTNTTFVPPALRAAATPVQEQDVLVISHASSVVTTTYDYQHPVADLPTTTPSSTTSASITPPTATSTPPVAGALVEAAATMLVNSIDGSLYAMNAVVGANNLVAEAPATSSVVAGPSTSAVSSFSISSVTTVYQPVYITVTADCPAPQTVTVTVGSSAAQSSSVSTASAPSPWTTTITSTRLVTRTPDSTSYTTMTTTTTVVDSTVTVTASASGLAKRRIGSGHAGNVQRHRARQV